MVFVEFAAQVGIAILSGLIIGLERQWRQHPVGLRTNALISLGACLFASVSSLVPGDTSPTRVAGQIVTGVGFLAGGVILRDGLTVKGLTTAATIWCTAAIGTLAGCGFLLYTVFSTVCVLFLNIVLHPLSQWIDKSMQKTSKVGERYQLLVACRQEQSSTVRSTIVGYFQSHRILSLQSIVQRDGKVSGQVEVVGQFVASEKCVEVMEALMGMLQAETGVNEVRWERMGVEVSA